MPDESQPSAPSSAPQPKAKSIRWWVSRFGNVGSFFLAGVVLIAMLGFAQRAGWVKGRSASSETSSAGGTQETYTCPMHPQIRQPNPGRCPICGMALVPATSAGADFDEIAVRIEPAQRRLANIQTAKVTKRPVANTIRTVGSIQIDESRQATIASYIDGRVERLFADYTGVKVAKGDHLAVVYSPQLYSAQVEYIEARRTLSTTNSAALAAVREAQTKLVANSRQRLVELGMTEEQIGDLEASNQPKSRLTIYSRIGGTVIERLAEEGKYISAGDPIYRIVNLSTVWLMLELYPEDASQIRFGQVVAAELTSLPGQTLTGRVAFIDSRVDKSKRTVGVRVEFKNDKGELRPGDHAQASIDIPIGPQGEVYDAELAEKWISPMHPQVIRDEPGDCPICGMKLVPSSRYGYVDQPVAQTESVTVPRSALLMAGKHSVVYVETEPGRFELRNVTLGPILRNTAIVVGGLKAGEQVATSGNFLIDSQMQLAGKPSLIDPTRFTPANRHRNTPLQFDSINVVRLEGRAGLELERLYQAYFEIQKAFSEDRQPSEKSVKGISRLSGELTKLQTLDKGVQELLTEIQSNAVHLHHLAIDEARKKFKPISHSVVTLATQLRGQAADQSFHHYFCPMVKEGQGDWLQANDELHNPYYGSEMLQCGKLVRTIPPDAHTAEHQHQHEQNDAQDEGQK